MVIEALLLTIGMKLAVAPITPDVGPVAVRVGAQTTYENGPLLCTILSKKDMRAAGAGGRVRRLHMFMCGEANEGTILGAFLKSSGVTYCAFGGSLDIDSGCIVLSGCGLDGELIC